MTDEMTLTHLWQEQGLGQAPFDAVCIISLPSQETAERNPSGYANAMSEACRDAKWFGVGLGSCNSCGQGLMNNVIIRDANRKHFVVGCDCARKTHDAKLISKVEYLEKQRQRQLKEERQAKERGEREARIAADLEAQRQRNGGLTDAEVKAEQRDAEQQAARKAMAEKNGWILDVLNAVPYASDFVDNMVNELYRRPLAELSERCREIIGEIYAKQVGGRRGSKKYQAAMEEYESKVG